MAWLLPCLLLCASSFSKKEKKKDGMKEQEIKKYNNTL
jgi:hypothetical protein